MNFKYIKLANAIKVGRMEYSFISSSTHEAHLENEYVIKVVDKASKATAYTTLFNTVYWELLDEPGSTKKEQSKITRAPKNGS